MSERSFGLRHSSRKPAPDRAITDLVVEFLGDTGTWEPQTPSLAMPCFRST